MTRNVAGAMLLALALGACTGPAPPSYTDAFSGLYNQSAAAVPVDAAVSLEQPVGVIFSENVERHMAFVKEANDYWASVVPGPLTNNVVLADTDPRYFAGRVLAMLKSHFPSAQVVHDFNEAVSSGKKAVCLVDLRMKPMEPYGDRTTKVDLDAYFFDARMNPVSRLSGHGERKVGFAGDAGVQASIDGAVGQLDAKIASLVH